MGGTRKGPVRHLHAQCTVRLTVNYMNESAIMFSSRIILICLIVKYIVYINQTFDSVSDNPTMRWQAVLPLIFNTVIRQNHRISGYPAPSGYPDLVKFSGYPVDPDPVAKLTSGGKIDIRHNPNNNTDVFFVIDFFFVDFFQYFYIFLCNDLTMKIKSNECEDILFKRN